MSNGQAMTEMVTQLLFFFTVLSESSCSFESRRRESLSCQSQSHNVAFNVRCMSYISPEAKTDSGTEYNDVKWRIRRREQPEVDHRCQGQSL